MRDGNRLGVQLTAQQVVRRKGVFGMSSCDLPFLSVNKIGR
jgi:hypothetical protein